jgi:hypothetical protein
MVTTQLSREKVKELTAQGFGEDRGDKSLGSLLSARSTAG